MRLLSTSPLLLAGTLLVGALLAGCAGRAELIPNSDAALRKTSAEFAADAARREYKADAPRGGEAKARAEVGYVLDRMYLINLSDKPWTDIEVWLNGEYVIFIPTLEPMKRKDFPFQAIFNNKGQSFPLGNGKIFNREPILVNKVELYRDGKLHDVPVEAAD